MPSEDSPNEPLDDGQDDPPDGIDHESSGERKPNPSDDREDDVFEFGHIPSMCRTSIVEDC